MGSTIFVSHAGSDSPKVAAIASALRAEHLRVRLDRDELRQGDSFLSFMEGALKTSDYCLLLWSRAASESDWVRVEWEAAFHRTVAEAQNFLVLGRLEDFPVPELLRPRLRVDLYPGIDTGIGRLIAMWREDERAEQATSRPVAPPKAELHDADAGETVYVTSELFGKTFPMKVNMSTPVGMILEDICARLSLPQQLDVHGRVGVRFRYSLVHGETVLRNDAGLNAQGLHAGDVLWLQTQTEPFSATEPVSGEPRKATYRGMRQADPLQEAQRHLMSAVERLGLGCIP